MKLIILFPIFIHIITPRHNIIFLITSPNNNFVVIGTLKKLVKIVH
jgi:hypothetical protein